MMLKIRAKLTYANVTATVAIVVALSGTASAAVATVRANSITSKHVKDNSLTGADMKNGSLGPLDLTPAARSSFKGPKGNNGPTGPKGLPGETGPQGEKGNSGAPAMVVTSYATRDTGFITRNTLTPPNPDGFDWWNYNCNSVNNSIGPCAGSDGNTSNTGVGDLPLQAARTTVLALSGINVDPDETQHTFQTANNIVVPWNSNLTGMASISVLHQTSQHERFECELQYANVATPSTFSSMGTKQVVSSFQPFEIVAATFVASKNVADGTYNVRLQCSDIDDSALVSWRFVRGNMTAMAARNG